MALAALPDYLSTHFDPAGEPIPEHRGDIIATVREGEREIGRSLYTAPSRVKAGQIIKYGGYLYKVMAEELRGVNYQIRVGERKGRI
jgi:hypothetical protein